MSPWMIRFLTSPLVILRQLLATEKTLKFPFPTLFHHCSPRPFYRSPNSLLVEVSLSAEEPHKRFNIRLTPLQSVVRSYRRLQKYLPNPVQLRRGDHLLIRLSDLLDPAVLSD